MSDQLGTCDIKQYEHVGQHVQIFEVGQSMPPFPCENWQPVTAREDQPMSYEQRRANLPQCPTCSSPNKSTYWGFCADEACQADRWHKSLPSEAQGAAPQQRNELLERALNLAHEWSAKFPLGGAMDTIAASQVYAAIEEITRGARRTRSA